MPDRPAAAGSSCGCATSSREPAGAWSTIAALPKVAYHHLRRALAPAAVWTTDEGLGGIVAHVANDGPEPLDVRLRVALYRDLEQRVGDGEEAIRLEAHGSHERGVEDLVGHFVGRVVGLSLRAARPGRRRGKPGAGRGRGHDRALPGVPLPGRATVAGRVRRSAGPVG